MTGAITISLDFELGWGVIGNGGWQERQKQGIYRELRPTLRRFVDFLDALDIPCIWAVVGAMIDDPTRLDLSHLKGNFAEKANFFLTNAEEQTHDGRDLLDIVMNAKSQQTFGTHGYSHVLFDDPDQDEFVIRTELERCRSANRSAGIDSRFFVFPENRTGYFDVVADAGIKIARTPPANAPSPDARPGLLKRTVGNVMRPISPVRETFIENGLILHAGSELLNWGTYGGKLKSTLSKRRNRRALSSAINGMHVHYWLHPFDLVATDGLLSFTEELLVAAAQARDTGKIEFRMLC